jgi:hypothetical protein
MFEIVDNLSHQKDAHSLRVGADFLYNDLKITYPRSIQGSYSFSSLASFQSGTYSTFTQTFGNPTATQTNPNVGFYVQDSWRVTPTFTLNAGVRYDLQFLDTIATDTNNVSPRVGVAWSVTPRTVVRASAGLFYDRVPLRPLANALLSADNTTNLDIVQQQSVNLAFGQAGAQESLEVERQLSHSATVNVNYQHVRGIHLLMSINQNVPGCSSKVDPLNLCRPDSAFQNNGEYSAAGDSQYDGLNISFLQRPARWGGYRVSYTFSKALDVVG